MNHRILHQIVCAHCAQPFTTSNITARYCSKSCSAKARTERDGPPPAAGHGANIRPSIEALKNFRRSA